MRHFPQTRQNNCGQTCVAIIEQRPIDEIEKLMGKTGLTNGSDVRHALGSLGWTVTGARRDRLWPVIDHAVLKVKGDERVGHFVVKRRNLIFDPALRRSIGLRKWLGLLATRDGGWRVTSYLKISGRQRG
jgi:hypothetical protein